MHHKTKKNNPPESVDLLWWWSILSVQKLIDQESGPKEINEKVEACNRSKLSNYSKDYYLLSSQPDDNRNDNHQQDKSAEKQQRPAIHSPTEHREGTHFCGADDANRRAGGSLHGRVKNANQQKYYHAYNKNP